MNQNETKSKSAWRKERLLRAGFLIALSGVMITQYQNCTPSGATAQKGAVSSTVVEEAGPVTVIDDVKADAAVSFMQKELSFHSSVNQAEVIGQCSLNQDGARMKWKIFDGASGQQLAEGFTDCLLGEFRVGLEPMQGLDCGHNYRITARLGFGHEGEIQISRRCAPDAIADGAALKPHLAGEKDASCVIEKRISGDQPSCQAVCYDQAGVVQAEHELPAEACQ